MAITKEEFTQKVEGYNTYYSSYLLIGTDMDSVINELNKIITGYCFPDGGIEENGSVRFNLTKEVPDLIYRLTKDLKCIGYADDWNGEYFICAKNGKDYDGYTAEWEFGDPYTVYGNEEEGWECHVNLTDNATGIVFNTGSLVFSEEVVSYYEDIVRKHKK